MIVFVALMATVITFGQKAEVLYFKANLACCQARACNELEKEVKDAIEAGFPGGDVLFRVIKLADKENAELVSKYNAKSQTLVVVAKPEKQPEKSEDISDLLRRFQRNRDKGNFEKEISTKIKELIT